MNRNIFKIEEIPVNEEITEILKENGNVKIEKIISKGQVSDWMIQDREEFVILLEGEAEIEFERSSENNGTAIEKKRLRKGDTVIIEKNEKHRVSYTSSNPYCIWICVFY